MMTKSFVAFILILFSASNYAEGINSITITQATLSAAFNKINGNCLNYKIPKGFCIWFSPFSGRVATPILDHYLPDLVVVVYRNNDENPWTEARLLLDKISAKAQESFLPNVGSGNHGFLDVDSAQVVFKEATVIGNPALVTFPHYFKFLVLKSTAKPMVPYFQSMLDSQLWRGFMPYALKEETAAAALTTLHHVGRGATDWGGIYPHEGTVVGNDDLKASMVIASRATDLLTNSLSFGHVYRKLSTSCGEHCKAKKIQENSEETLYQMIYPSVENECVVLGSDKSYDSKVLNKKGAYAWIVWRHYRGCPDGEGKLIGVIE